LAAAILRFISRFRALLIHPPSLVVVFAAI
jgi:hypothetical protein